MKRPPPPTSPPDEDDDWEQILNDLKDVSVSDADALPDESSIACRLQDAFVLAGYRLVRIEEVQTHPVVVVRAVRQDAPRIDDHRLFCRHMRDVLRQAGFDIKMKELTVGQTGKRILVAFQTGKWEPNFEEILREPQEDLGDYGELPL